MREPYSFVLVCEAEADRLLATTLADRVLCEQVDWITPELLDAFRRWRSCGPEEPFLPWRSVGECHRRLGAPRVFGHFDGRPGGPDALATRKCLLACAWMKPAPVAVLLVRDTDGDRGREVGVRQAVSERSWPFAVVVGMAHPKREAWILAGFEPEDDRERELLEQLRRELGFDPLEHPERLDARQHGAKTDAKRVLAILTSGSVDREGPCFEDRPLQNLKERGEATGLAGFITGLESALVAFHR